MALEFLYSSPDGKIMPLNLPVYFDNNATTPVDPRVLETMLPYFTEKFGNAASRSHLYGWEAGDAVEHARGQVADLIGAESKEIVFTSGASESDNIAIKGVMENYADKGNHLITVATEHKAVLDTALYLEKKGYNVTILPVNADGRITAEQVEAAITDQTILISVMLANNETGVIHPVKEIGEVAEKHGVFFHCDATQAIGKMKVDVSEMKIHLLSMSGHKIYGPKGVGALYARSRNPRVRPEAVIHGGGHEKKMRSGTLNVPGIVGLGAACEIAKNEMDIEIPRLLELRTRLEKGVLEALEEVYINGNHDHRLPNTINFSFKYVESESLFLKMENIAVSSGSACTSASLESSYVLNAMGVTDTLINGSLRFSLGRFTTEEEIDFAIPIIIKAVIDLREISPLYEMAQKGIDIDKIDWSEYDRHHH